MKKIVFLVLFSFLFFCAKAQINLVKNPSFENYIQCPHTPALVSAANYWSAIVDTTYSLDTNFAYHFAMGTITQFDAVCFPHYCNTCDNNSLDPSRAATVPDNQHFYHYPHTGNGLMLLDLYEYNSGFICRAYLQGRLYHSLVAGQTYCVSFYVINSNVFNAGCNHIGAYFDNGTIDTTTECGHAKTEYTPQILDDSIVFDTVNWTKIQGTFTATGTERFFTIGNFSDSANISFRKFDTTVAYTYAVYLLDDVSVIAINDSASAGPDGITSPTGDSVWVGDTTGYLPCYWYANGALVDSNKAGFKAHPDTTTSYVMVLDVCGNVTTDTAVVWVYPLASPRPSPKEREVNIYPNPATNLLTIGGGMGCEVMIYDLVGRVVKREKIISQKQAIDISGLGKGVYNVEIKDTETGARTTKKIVKM